MNRKDYFYNKAKDENYPARSVYKLEDIDKKYNLVRVGDKILDLGCSPGSWMKYCSKKVGNNGLVVGIDIKDIGAEFDQNVIFFKEDIFQLKIEKLKETTDCFDIVLSDMAPNTTGTRWVDQARSLDLVQQAFAIAQEFLKPAGDMVCKIFQGPDVKQLTETMRKKFSEVKIVKPKGSRKESFEVFLVCRNHLK